MGRVKQVRRRGGTKFVDARGGREGIYGGFGLVRTEGRRRGGEKGASAFTAASCAVLPSDLHNGLRLTAPPFAAAELAPSARRADASCTSRSRGRPGDESLANNVSTPATSVNKTILRDEGGQGTPQRKL